MSDREFWLAIRQALLMFVAAIEQKQLPGVIPTAELRKLAKHAKPERS